jgi:fructosamine-3-kinase
LIPWHDIERDIGAATGAAFTIAQRSAGGGCINAAWAIEGSGRRYFVKVNEASRAAMFEAEAAGLAELQRASAVRVPEAICHGVTLASSWIVLEYIQLGARTGASDAALGSQLAELHRHTAAHYGWLRDNTIGSTPQPNTRSSTWPTFWRDQRLAFQLRLAEERGYGGKVQTKGAQLLEHVPAFFESYTPAPSLLHGDLWSGNAACDATGVPVIFDPAVYYGGRVEMWRGSSRLGVSVAASFVWRCPSNFTVAPFPHPAHRTGHADLPHPALGQELTPSSTTRRTQAAISVRDRSARRGARVDSSRPCVA